MEPHDCHWFEFQYSLGAVCINDRCPLHRAMRVLGANLTIAAFGAAMFKAGDNFGFHMGADESQCMCQWSPNTHGEAYRKSTRCEQDEAYDDRDEDDDLFGDDEWPDNLPVIECECPRDRFDTTALDDAIGYPCESCGGIVR